MPCITIQFDPTIGPIIRLGVALPNSFRPSPKGHEGETPTVRVVQALVDSGADRTCVSAEVAREIGLPLIGKTQVSSASDVTATNVYLGDLALPFGEPGKSQSFAQVAVEILEFHSTSQHYQALLGRDILCLGYFSMAGYDRRFTFCM